MRFVFYLLLTWALCGVGQAQSSQSIQKRLRGPTEIPVAATQYTVSAFAERLGHISAMTGTSDGTLYITDQVRGRLYQITDRDKDGFPDTTRMIADGFEAPSGLAVYQGQIFVADAQAIWTISSSNYAKVQFVSLANIDAKDVPRPLIMEDMLLLGLTDAAGSGQIIAINPDTGRAVLRARGPEGVGVLAMTGDTLWGGSETSIFPINGSELNTAKAVFLGPDVQVTGLALPGQFSDWPEGFEALQQHILIAKASETIPLSKQSSGMEVVSLPTQFGLPSGDVEPFLTGFVTGSGRTGWGMPGPIWIDARGVFVADSWSGTIWRVEKTPEAKPPMLPTPKDTERVEAPATAKTDGPPGTLPLVEGIEQTPGSLLTQGSSIKQGATLKVGSTIIEAYEADKDKEGAETTSAPKN